MPAADHGNLRGKVPLCIEIVNRALALATSDQWVTHSKTWGERSPLGVWNGSVVTRRPALLRHVESSVDRQAQVVKPAGADIEIGDSSGAESVGKSYRHALTLRRLSAAVFTHASGKRILRQAEQLPIAESAKNAVRRIDVLIHASHVFIYVAASAGCFKEIIYSPAAGRVGN